MSVFCSAVHSFVELFEFVLIIPDVLFLMSSRICQDPLENIFGQPRRRGRVNENPNVAEFKKNMQALNGKLILLWCWRQL